MGIFEKLKQNFSHGGVKLQVQAPSSASMQSADLPVNVVVTANEQAANITSLTVELVAIPRQSGPNQNASQQRRTLTQARTPESFSLQAGESKTFTFNLSFNIESALSEVLPDGAAAGVGRLLQGLQTAAQSLGGADYNYFVSAVADVEGIAFDPSASQPIQMLAPGQFGGSIGGSL